MLVQMYIFFASEFIETIHIPLNDLLAKLNGKYQSIQFYDK